MATPTDQELLNAVKRAMAGTLDRNAGSYMLGGKRLDSLDMDALLIWRKDLELRVSRAATGGYAEVARFQKAV